MTTGRYGIATGMSFEVAMKRGRLDEARSMLDDLARSPDTGELWLPECYADLAHAFDRGLWTTWCQLRPGSAVTPRGR
jgi:hypothetical protein